MEFIKDKWSLLIKCDNEEMAKRITQGIATLLNKSSYEDELGLYDIEGNIRNFWTVKNYFTIATEGDEIDFIEETIKKLLARFGVTESKSEEGTVLKESLKDLGQIRQEVLDAMRDRHPDCITGAGKDGEDIYFVLATPDFELEQSIVDEYNTQKELDSWAKLGKRDDGRWILIINVQDLVTSNGQEADLLVKGIAEDAAKASNWLDEQLQQGTRSWGL